MSERTMSMREYNRVCELNNTLREQLGSEREQNAISSECISKLLAVIADHESTIEGLRDTVRQLHHINVENAQSAHDARKDVCDAYDRLMEKYNKTRGELQVERMATPSPFDVQVIETTKAACGCTTHSGRVVQSLKRNPQPGAGDNSWIVII
jgi:hypothetical protein